MKAEAIRSVSKSPRRGIKSTKFEIAIRVESRSLESCARDPMVGRENDSHRIGERRERKTGER